MKLMNEIINKIEELETEAKELLEGSIQRDIFEASIKTLNWVMDPPQYEKYPLCVGCSFNRVIEKKEVFGPCKDCELGHGGKEANCYHTSPSILEELRKLPDRRVD